MVDLHTDGRRRKEFRSVRRQIQLYLLITKGMRNEVPYSPCKFQVTMTENTSRLACLQKNKKEKMQIIKDVMFYCQFPVQKVAPAGSAAVCGDQELSEILKGEERGEEPNCPQFPLSLSLFRSLCSMDVCFRYLC